MKILLNGCSYVHGFDAAWDYGLNPRLTEDARRLGSPYWHLLQKINLGGNIGRLLGASEVVNLARNGNSNDIIVYETIQHFNALRHQDFDPQEWLVLIGWTEPARMIAFDDKNNHSVVSFNPFLIDDWIKRTSGYDESRADYLRDFYERNRDLSRHLMKMMTPDDLANQLIRSVLSLQSYLDGAGVRYLFWNSLQGMPEPRGSFMTRIAGSIINADSWMHIGHNPVPAIHTGWYEIIPNHERTPTGHPGIHAIEKFSRMLADFVLEKHGSFH